MFYDDILGYFDVSSKSDRDILLNSNPEYAEINSVITQYETCVSLRKKYFCRQEWFNSHDPEFREAYYVYDDGLAKENMEFVKKWPKQKDKLVERLKKKSNLFKGSRKRDENTLKLGEIKFAELSNYYEINNKFAQLESSLKEQETQSNAGDILWDYLVRLYAKRQDIVDEFLAKKGTSTEEASFS